ncbi:MAG: 5-oxoprolinase subunit PxpB [Proteobacteria bacterium]|nr:5-oxoprolinase subunit PxpB [Pseudomonadota bacterium]MBU1585682.1 5-oxoprolinase subunit PxpB [Pseudomonadota bacterium]MBU2451891.1 5-oxoprolinase subunit PxpB [Pseudomonadota bacterium]MBU2628707.1 5-oxoprolinase subunit PxpB [Pseudomonadota bacterium]
MGKGRGKKIIWHLAGDTGIIVEFGQGIDPDVNAKVRAVAAAIKKNTLQGVIEIIPTYRALLLIYDPLITLPEKLVRFIEQVETTLDYETAEPFKVVEIPVCYGGPFGPDIETVAEIAGIGVEEVIRLHSKPEYLIYMVGFTPGFPFLGGLDEKLFTPRLKTPRMAVPEGSVGIANNQTGMYPVTSPGGWQIIGRTPLTLFAPQRENPFLYQAGDKIKFIPISRQEYTRLKEKEAD